MKLYFLVDFIKIDGVFVLKVSKR